MKTLMTLEIACPADGHDAATVETIINGLLVMATAVYTKQEPLGVEIGFWDIGEAAANDDSPRATEFVYVPYPSVDEDWSLTKLSEEAGNQPLVFRICPRAVTLTDVSTVFKKINTHFGSDDEASNHLTAAGHQFSHASIGRGKRAQSCTAEIARRLIAAREALPFLTSTDWWIMQSWLEQLTNKN